MATFTLPSPLFCLQIDGNLHVAFATFLREGRKIELRRVGRLLQRPVFDRGLCGS